LLPGRQAEEGRKIRGIEHRERCSTNDRGKRVKRRARFCELAVPGVLPDCAVNAGHRDRDGLAGQNVGHTGGMLKRAASGKLQSLRDDLERVWRAQRDHIWSPRRSCPLSRLPLLAGNAVGDDYGELAGNGIRNAGDDSFQKISCENSSGERLIKKPE